MMTTTTTTTMIPDRAADTSASIAGPNSQDWLLCADIFAYCIRKFLIAWNVRELWSGVRTAI
ncbi:MAG TPA: hypothetical protein VMZ26_09300 [Pyrinomonadaceae bacterium]|nr:hypothetical protein [Pyrinomonadaceae bacterium]